MTEANWLNCKEPFMLWGYTDRESAGWWGLLRHLFIGPPRVRKRKDLLVNCSFSRRYWDNLRADEQQAIEAVERMIDVQQVSEFREAADRSTQALWNVLRQFDRDFAERHADGTAEETAIAREILEQANKYLCCLIRDVRGNPFRTVVLDPRWQTPTVIALAQVIYHERAFDRMPILADALMDAGCDNEDIINHCRSNEVHVRGCWLIDLLIGKK